MQRKSAAAHWKNEASHRNIEAAQKKSGAVRGKSGAAESLCTTAKRKDGAAKRKFAESFWPDESAKSGNEAAKLTAAAANFNLRSALNLRGTPLPLLAFLVFLLLTPAPLRAALLTYEDFNYAPTSDLSTVGAGGFGWAGSWQDVNGNGVVRVDAGNLTPTGASAGLALSGQRGFCPGTDRAGRWLDTSSTGPFGSRGYLDSLGRIGADGKTIYVSFLMQPDGTTYFYEFEFHRGNVGDSGRIAGIGNDVNGGVNVNLRAPNDTQTLIGAGDTAVNFYVVRIDFKAGNDDVRVYRNPALGTEPATPTLTKLAAADMSFDGLAFASWLNSRMVAIDEIRIGETYADVTPLAAPPAIVAQPQSMTNAEGASATFAVQATPQYGVNIQWRRSGTNIVGATLTNFTLTPLALSDSGATFSCVVTNALGAVTSSIATLTVTNDITPPAIVSIATPGVGSTVIVTFSEPLAAATATNATNYVIAPGVTVSAAAFGADNHTVVLTTTTTLARGVIYTLTVNNLRDLAFTPNPIPPNTQLTFSAIVTPLDTTFLKPAPEPLGPSSRRTPLVLSEIMFHPTNRADGRNLQFVEIFNSQVFSEDISGYRLSGSISFTFPSNTVMPAHAFYVVAAAPADVQAVYGLSGVFGPWADSNGLPNSSGTVRLRNAQDALLLEVNYSGDPPWPLAPDGAGHSLVLARPSFGEADPRAWAASDALGGSPGAFESSVSAAGGLGAVVINEFLANSDAPQLDFIELFNYSTQAVNLAGCFLSDDAATNKFTLPSGVIPPLGFVSFDEAQLGFALSSGGEQILFRAPDGRVLDAIRFDAQARGISCGRTPDGAPEFRPLPTPTPGTANSAARAAAVVFNEIMYAPISGNSDDEYVELFNRSPNAVDLSDWHVRGGISFNLPSGTVLAAGGYLVVARNTARLLTNYANLNSANTLGNFSGGLGNSGDQLKLLRPETTVTTNGARLTTNTIHVLENEVTYGVGGRWGQWSHAGGSSLELRDARSDNRLAPNWADSDDTAKSGWVTIQYTGVLDNGISPADSLQIELLGPGECLVDDVEVTPSGGANLLSNPGFESGATGWYFQGTHSKSTVEAGGAFSGAGVLHLRASDGGDPGADRIRSTLTSTLSSGQTVTLRAKVRWLRGYPEILLRLRGGWLEAAGNILAARNQGTPGLPNSAAAANAGPAITDVSHSPALPAANQAVTVTARVSDPDGLASPQLKYRLDPASNLVSVIMEDRGAGWFSATLPGQAAGALVAFRIEARDAGSPVATNLFPNDAPRRECLVRWGESVPAGALGAYRIWITQSTFDTWSNREKNSNERLDATFVYGNWRVIYNAGTMYSGSAFHTPNFTTPTGNPCDYRVGWPDDDLFLGVTDARLVGPGTFGDDATDQREQTIYWIARQLNIPFYNRRHVHFYVNGIHRGSIMEDAQQPNGDFIGQWFSSDASGTVHKCTDWIEFDDAGQGFVGLQRATLTNCTTTGGAKKTTVYRGMWPLHAADSMNDYTNLFTLVDTVNLEPPEPYTVDTRALIDVEEWMRALVIQRIAGNFDSWGYLYGKNMFAYKPQNGPWALFPWDIDFSFNLGSIAAGDSPTTDLFSPNTDPVSVKMTSHPPFRRAYWRALQDAVNGPLVTATVNARLDEVYAALASNGVAVIAPAEVKSYISQRRAFILTNLATVAAPFDITPGADFSTNRNLVTLTGRAPVEVKTIKVNGVAYEPTWTSATNWTLRVELTAPTNTFLLEAFDLRGLPISGETDTIKINLTAPGDSPVGKVVFNEIQFDPAVAGASFVELFNASTNTAFDLSSWRVNGLGYSFPAATILGPREFLILAKDRFVFQSAYGTNVVVFDEFPGTLQNDGEMLTLIKPGATPDQDVVIAQVRYDSIAPWPTNTHGTGVSLQLIDAAQDNWRVSNWGVTQTDWRFASVTGAAGSARLYLFLSVAGEAWVDDISLVSGSTPGVGTNLVRNGGFESAFRTNQGGPWIVPNNMSNSVVVMNSSHSGAASLHVLATSGGGGAATSMYEDVLPIVTNATHTLCFWYRSGTNSGNLTVRLQPGSGIINTVALGTPAAVATPGTTNTVVALLPAYPLLWLNEVQPNNTSGLTDNHGEREPWIELYNSGTNALSLSGFFLANNFLTLTQWAFPSGAVLSAGEFKVLFADGEPGESTTSEWHTSFRLTSPTGSVALVRLVNSTPQIVDYLNYSVSAPNRSFGSVPDGQPFERREMFYATPGATNNGAAPPVAVYINEWMAANTHTLANPANGKFDDWFEIYNPGTNTADLGGCYLTDTLTDPFQFQVPNNGQYVVPPGGFLLVWADGSSSHNTTNAADLHVSFQLSKSGEAIGLFASDGTLIDAVTFGSQTNDVSQGRYPDGFGPIYFLPAPTPRAANQRPFQTVTGQVELENFVGPARNGVGTRLVTLKATDDAGRVLRRWDLTLSLARGASGFGVASFTLTDAPMTATHLSAKTAWNLRKRQPLTFSGGPATADFTGLNRLPGGDIDDSNLVDFGDFNQLAAFWYTTDAASDINGSGLVDIEDYFILASRWFLQGDAE